MKQLQMNQLPLKQLQMKQLPLKQLQVKQEDVESKFAASVQTLQMKQLQVKQLQVKQLPLKQLLVKQEDVESNFAAAEENVGLLGTYCFQADGNIPNYLDSCIIFNNHLWMKVTHNYVSKFSYYPCYLFLNICC